MEPVDPLMGGLLGGVGDAGGPDELREIVAKAGRRMRWRSAALAGAVAVVAGGGVGYAVSGTGGSGHQVVATSPASQGAASGAGSAPSANGASVSGAPSMALPESGRLTHLFNRQANGVNIRGYLVASAVMLPANTALTCGAFGARLQAEVSTADMVAVASSGFVVQQTTSAILTEQPSIVGEAEGDPVGIVVVQTGPSVAKVRMEFTGGSTDEMTPVQGWSALAAPLPGWQPGKVGQVTIGTLTALDRSGHTVGTTTVQWPAMVPLPAGGSAGSGGGSSGAGASGPGTASSGPASTVSGSTGSGSTGSGSTGSGTGASSGIAYPCVMSPPPTFVCPTATTSNGVAYACPAMPVPASTMPYKPAAGG